MGRTFASFAISTLAVTLLCCGNKRPPPLMDYYPDSGAAPPPPMGGFGGGDAGDNGPTMLTGTPVDVHAPCDSALAIDGDAASFAKAIGICTTAAQDGYGLVSATYVKGYGSTDLPANGQWGILPKFGAVIVPREGMRLGVLSSGWAREYDDADGTPGSDFVDSSSIMPSNPVGTAPPGFPKAAAGCQQDGVVNDMIDVKLVLKAPMDAAGFQFDFDFYSSEWPDYVCSNFNDAFVAYLTSANKTDNVSFDSMNNPVSVNNAFLDRCTPGTTTGCGGNGGQRATCPAGPGELAGTGFGTTSRTMCDQAATDGGATGWLRSQAPVKAGEQFTLELMIWNAGDEALDSSVLIDNFTWLGGEVTGGTTRVK